MGVLTAVLACSVLAGVVVLFWDWLGLGTVPTLHQYEVHLQFTARSLAHVSRIWRQDDLRYVRDLPAGRHLLARLRRDRRRIRRLILLDLCRQFRASVAVATMLATLPTARRSNIGLHVLLWNARFHLALTGLLFSSLPFLDRMPGISPAGLLEHVETANGATRALMAALTDTDMGDLKTLILSE